MDGKTNLKAKLPNRPVTGGPARALHRSYCYGMGLTKAARHQLRIAEAREPERFVDEADLGEIVVRTIHRVERLDQGRARVTYRMEITGPAADTLGPEIGPEISGDFPQVLAALAARAEGRA